MKTLRVTLLALVILAGTVMFWSHRGGEQALVVESFLTARQRAALVAGDAYSSGQVQERQRHAARRFRSPSSGLVPNTRPMPYAPGKSEATAQALTIIDKGTEPESAPLPADHVLIHGEPAHPNRLLARMAQGMDAASFEAGLTEQGLRLINDPTANNGLALIQTPLALADAGTALQQWMKALEATGLVAYAEPDFILTTAATPTDSAFANGWMWGLRNTGTLAGSKAGVDIDAARAWDLTTGSANVVVAVIDSGVRHSHQALAANMWRNPSETAGNGLDDDGDGFVDNVFGMDAANNDGDPMDDHGHGTHVAGTIGAQANDESMTVGVAWQVRIMACKFLGKEGYGYTSDEIRCIDFAVSKGAKVINCSYGSRSFSQAQHDAFKRARDRGVLVVAAAGNDGLNTDVRPHYPSCLNLENVISVAAVDASGAQPSWSNYGPRSVDLGAPGVSILSSLGSGDGAYAWWSGTSMAAPHVTGAAALVLAHRPTATLAQLRGYLINTARPMQSLAQRTVSGGMLNAYNALLGSGDGILELTASTSSNPLRAGKVVTLRVVVTDVLPVANATVTAQVSGVGALTLLDGGAAPDERAGDAVYTARFAAPTDRAQSTVTIQISAAAEGKQAASLTLELALLHPPVNDNLKGRALLTGTSGVLGEHNNFGASAEAGEPMHYRYRASRSIWFEWTAPAAGTATFDTKGSSFDTVMAAYTGNAYGKLRKVASDDDNGGNLTSKITFKTVAGQSYVIAVDSYAGWYEGNVRGNYSFAAPAATQSATARRR